MADASYRILITGAAGMLGKDISAELAQVKGFDVYSLVRAEVASLPGNQVVADLGNKSEVLDVMQTVRPDCIIHCAAMTDLERCERERDAAYRINVEAVDGLVTSMPENCRFIYISTDSVFDGFVGTYSEEDVPHPLNYYAETKLMGERVALHKGVASLVVRTNLYGFHIGLHGRSLIEWAYANLSRGQAIKGYDDTLFNPLYTRQIAALLIKFIARRDLSGILNIGASEQVSKFDFLRKFAAVFGYDSDLVERSSSGSAQSKIKRPLNTTLDCSRLLEIIGCVPLLSDGLRQLNKDFKDNFE